MARIEVEDFTESENSFSVYVKIDGKHGRRDFRHTFPKDSSNLEEDENGVPNFIKKLKKKYKDEAGKEVSSMGNEEKSPGDYKGEYDV